MSQFEICYVNEKTKNKQQKATPKLKETILADSVLDFSC